MTGNKSLKVSSFSPVKTHYKSLKPMCSESRCLQSPIYIYILDIFYLHVIYKTDFKKEKNASKLRLGANKNCQTTCTICHTCSNSLSILLVFSVTPFKIDQNKNQNCSIDKVRNLGNERR